MVRVKLFANFREIVNKSELLIEACTVRDLLVKLSKRYPKLGELIFDEKGNLRTYVNIAVNGEIVSDYDVELDDDDVVAIFPPVSGG